MTTFVREVESERLTAGQVDETRALLTVAFERDGVARFDESDWEHALGGRHFLLEEDGRIVGHAAVVPRVLEIAGRPVRTGYVEAVAVAPGRQNEGAGSLLMTAVGRHIEEAYELGALSTDRPTFYERLGWQRWRGPTSVRTETDLLPTPDDDGGIMVLGTRSAAADDLLRDLDTPISCAWRRGDVW